MSALGSGWLASSLHEYAWVWGVVVFLGAFMVTRLYVMWRVKKLLPVRIQREVEKALAKAEDKAKSIQRFDMPIRSAILYLANTVPHTFDRSSLVERNAFNGLHKLMCDGELAVIGATKVFGVCERIPPSRCRELVPEEQVVPLSPSSPDGIRLLLINYADKNWKKDWDGKTQPEIIEQYTDLRLRSSDVYRIWPKGTA